MLMQIRGISKPWQGSLRDHYCAGECRGCVQLTGRGDRAAQPLYIQEPRADWTSGAPGVPPDGAATLPAGRERPLAP